MNEEPSKEKGINRRGLLLGIGSAAALLSLGGVVKLTEAEALCRPPGGQDEDSFIGLCLRCEKCREVCPEGVIVPATLETGLINARTPTLDYTLGWCDFCERGNNGSPRCIEVCPTQALKLPAGIKPTEAVIGEAYIVENWCLAWQLKGCTFCYDECPFDAITMDSTGRPSVIASACNGCGRCENVCPSLMVGSVTEGARDRAITVIPVETAAKLRAGRQR